MIKAKHESFATDPLTIWVSAADLEQAEHECSVERGCKGTGGQGGQKNIARNCVLAQAFKRNPLFKNSLRDVRVLKHFTKVKLVSGETLVYRTPKGLPAVLTKWDSGEPWQGPVNEVVVFSPCEPNNRTPEQKQQLREKDLARKPATGKPKTLVAPRHLTPWG